MKEVKIYSTPTCHFCHMAKDFFEEEGIAYTDYNVAEDLEKRTEMIGKTGQLGVPVIDIDGQVVIGFNEARILELLK
jgi:glutaredoxin 3